MNSQVEELFHSCCATAANDLLCAGEVPFQAIFLTRCGKLAGCVADMPDSPRERDAVVSLLRLMAIAHDAVAAVIISEMWLASPDCHDGVRPSEDPNRRELLSVMVIYRDEVGVFQILCGREIIRDESGQAVDLGAPKEPLTPVRCEECTGRLYRILPRERSSRHERRLAKKLIDRLPNHFWQSAYPDGFTVH
jgi:hypothetical protein